jgi:hypothetical protein
MFLPYLGPELCLPQATQNSEKPTKKKYLEKIKGKISHAAILYSIYLILSIYTFNFLNRLLNSLTFQARQRHTWPDLSKTQVLFIPIGRFVCWVGVIDASPPLFPYTH